MRFIHCTFGKLRAIEYICVLQVPSRCGFTVCMSQSANQAVHITIFHIRGRVYFVWCVRLCALAISKGRRARVGAHINSSRISYIQYTSKDSNHNWVNSNPIITFAFYNIHLIRLPTGTRTRLFWKIVHTHTQTHTHTHSEILFLLDVGVGVLKWYAIIIRNVSNHICSMILLHTLLHNCYP